MSSNPSPGWLGSLMGSKSIHWKSAICFFLAIVFVLLFYVYGMDRANYFMFKIGQGAFALLDSLECRFLFFYTVFSLYVALLFFLTFVYSHDTVSVLSFVARFLRQRHTLLIICSYDCLTISAFPSHCYDWRWECFPIRSTYTSERKID